MPATPLEAAACGCWPLVPEIDGLAEAFGGIRDFCYTPPQTALDLSARIRDTIAWCEQPIYNDAIINARSIAARYSVEAMVEAYIGLYENLLATPL
jgi:glycosyltransferase involved in cell wall biosynthesis